MFSLFSRNLVLVRGIPILWELQFFLNFSSILFKKDNKILRPIFFFLKEEKILVLFNLRN